MTVEIGPATLAGIRFPRALLASESAERLLVGLGVEIVDEMTPELEAAARAWVAEMPASTGQHDVVPSTVVARRVLGVD